MTCRIKHSKQAVPSLPANPPNADKKNENCVVASTGTANLHMKTIETKILGDTSKIGQIAAILSGAELEKAWRDCLGTWEDSSPAQRADCRAFAVNLRDNFLRILKDVDDAEEQETIGTIFYTQVKSQWILINTQAGYQIRNGRVEGALFCRAGMLSALLGSLEPVLRQSDLTRITNFLAGPEGNDPASHPDTTRLSSLLGIDVNYESPSPDECSAPRVTVDATEIENRFRELSARVHASDQQWSELQEDLGVGTREEIVELFEQLQRRSIPAGESGPDDAVSRAAQAEWVERRELQLRSVRNEASTLRADWEQLRIETGFSNVAPLIVAWRDLRDSLKTVRTELASERSSVDALRAEYGDEVTAGQVIAELRHLSSELARVRADWDKLRCESEYLEREFGTFNADQMVALVRGLRDRLAEVSAQATLGVAQHDSLVQEFGTSEAGDIIARVREMRDNLAAATREMIPLRADRYVLQNELGKTDAREIVAHMRTLEARIESYSEMSELLGSMEKALKTLD